MKETIKYPFINKIEDANAYLDNVLIPLYDDILVNGSEKTVVIEFPDAEKFPSYYIHHVFSLLSLRYSIGSVLSVTEVVADDDVKQEFNEIIEEIEYDEEDFEEFVDKEVELLREGSKL